jgi:hypothetical protein
MDVNVNETVEKIKAFPFTIGIILFGSQLMKATPISDIDLCVLDDINFPRGERLKVYELSTDKVDISLFSELPLYIKFEVLKGKIIWLRDQKFLQELKEKIVLDYLEMKPLWRKLDEKRMEKWLIRGK